VPVLVYPVGVKRSVILFDDDCGFCRWSLSKILLWDHHSHLRPVALQSPEADDLLMGMDPERKMASWHLVTPDGRTHSGGGAMSHLARLLPAGAPISAREYVPSNDGSILPVGRQAPRSPEPRPR
jgi:predicted DCC family thiol-disulfide oxidoreductase YuxK